jgi:hypothetical protein
MKMTENRRRKNAGSHVSTQRSDLARFKRIVGDPPKIQQNDQRY